MNPNEIQKELKDLSSTLADHPLHKKVDIPDGYFAKMQACVLDQTIGEEEAESVQKSGLSMIWIRNIAAAVMILIATGIGLWVTQNQTDEQSDLFVEITDEEMFEYILSESSDLDLLSDINPAINDTEDFLWEEDEADVYEDYLKETELEFL